MKWSSQSCLVGDRAAPFFIWLKRQDNRIFFYGHHPFEGATPTPAVVPAHPPSNSGHSIPNLPRKPVEVLIYLAYDANHIRIARLVDDYPRPLNHAALPLMMRQQKADQHRTGGQVTDGYQDGRAGTFFIIYSSMQQLFLLSKDCDYTQHFQILDSTFLKLVSTSLQTRSVSFGENVEVVCSTC